ncbi:uncharacterized protein BDV14DRAFT_168648 [Aspergillus stella-maris]|uniref:uncharacterized protein n=1 Tax=Aspergillus stella-maris TaxID=1810926 RepID=UPI003CCD3985
MTPTTPSLKPSPVQPMSSRSKRTDPICRSQLNENKERYSILVTPDNDTRALPLCRKLQLRKGMRYPVSPFAKRTWVSLLMLFHAVPSAGRCSVNVNVNVNNKASAGARCTFRTRFKEGIMGAQMRCAWIVSMPVPVGMQLHSLSWAFHTIDPVER